MMYVFQREPGLVDGYSEAILNTILKVLCIMYHHSLIRPFASKMTRIAQLQQIAFGVFEVVGLPLPCPLHC